jgi:hypothetical protein
MNSGDLTPTDHDQLEPTSNEVQFALVIARMIDTVQNSPEHMRQAVYDLARYKLQEQFTHAAAKDIKRTQEALESAIRGVEQFSKQRVGIPPPPPVPQLNDSALAPRTLPAPDSGPPVRSRPRLEIGSDPVEVARLVRPKTTRFAAQPTRPLSLPVKRTAAMLLIIGGGFLVIQQRERLASWAQYLPKSDEKEVALLEQHPPTRAADAPLPAPPAPKPNPLRPTDYGVYAVVNDSLAELQLLPGRPPDIRVAVSAALKAPARTVLPNGHPKFIVFRRDATTNAADRAEVRIVARIAREFSAEAAGRRLSDSEDTWVIRNVVFPFRTSPLPDTPEMYELHSEDPALELTPGRYALILKNQAYDFSVEGQATDSRQCMERVVTTTGTFYTDCKKL